jgi:hypothetical protein
LDWLLLDWRLPALFLPAAAATAAAAVPTAAAAAAAIFLRPGFVHVQRPAIEFPAIQARNGSISLGCHTHLHESKAPGAPGVPVGDDVDAVDRAIRFKHGSNCFFGSSEAKVSNENILQFKIFFLEFAEQRIAGRLDGFSGLCERRQLAELSNYTMMVTRNRVTIARINFRTGGPTRNVLHSTLQVARHISAKAAEPLSTAAA